TLASTGTPSFFMHPAEAMHGDLGMLRKEDVVILLSYSGETEEITRLLPMLKVVGSKTIAITKNRSSTLGKNADIVLELGSLEEACPMGLAPTTSTTAMLALGDALAIVLLKIRHFDEKQYAFFHPGGSLGKKLLTVKDLMRTDERCPILSEERPVKEVMLAVSSARAGSAIIVSSEGKLVGVFTDGDLRRHLNRSLVFIDGPVSEVMTRNPKYVEESVYALEAVGIMKEFMIGELPVVDQDKIPLGLLDLKDLVNIGLLDL
ncbi:MAG: KpsF/GutQ family sugar-phosphate isomerase, partial [Candidatus Aureabacteria bacterium]|nr:KpsF/GutQ family sugar-phosphate isomerase [Candidatus Auribacterota bacterium]